MLASQYQFSPKMVQHAPNGSGKRKRSATTTTAPGSGNSEDEDEYQHAAGDNLLDECGGPGSSSLADGAEGAPWAVTCNACRSRKVKVGVPLTHLSCCSADQEIGIISAQVRSPPVRLASRTALNVYIVGLLC